jgi:Putative DNA-binding domain
MLGEQTQAGRAGRQLPQDTTESKRTVFKTVAAFANGYGGNMVFGIEKDEATVCGLDGIDPLREGTDWRSLSGRSSRPHRRSRSASTTLTARCCWCSRSGQARTGPTASHCWAGKTNRWSSTSGGMPRLSRPQQMRFGTRCWRQHHSQWQTPLGLPRQRSYQRLSEGLTGPSWPRLPDCCLLGCPATAWSHQEPCWPGTAASSGTSGATRASPADRRPARKSAISSCDWSGIPPRARRPIAARATSHRPEVGSLSVT